jgi:hypothetical protein
MPMVSMVHLESGLCRMPLCCPAHGVACRALDTAHGLLGGPGREHAEVDSRACAAQRGEAPVRRRTAWQAEVRQQARRRAARCVLVAASSCVECFSFPQGIPLDELGPAHTTEKRERQSPRRTARRGGKLGAPKPRQGKAKTPRGQRGPTKPRAAIPEVLVERVPQIS